MSTPPFIEELARLAGVNVLDVELDNVVTDANAIRAAVPSMAMMAEHADLTMGRATEEYQGQSATALAENWQEVGGSGGRLQQTGAAMNVLPPVTNGFASVASAARLAEITQLVELATTLKVAMGTGAAGAGFAAGKVAFSRLAILRIKHTFERGVATRLTPAVQRITRRFEELGEQVAGPRGGLGNLAPAGGGGRSPYEIRPLQAASPGNPGMRTNMGWGRKDNTGKFHGDIPDTTIGTTAAERRRLAKELRDSIKTREEEDA
ncbi:hypothetical protein, partial [Streptosporangium sp. KLBMP 9127]|nr:hypothetical protein [Streptosporangium sp. KLBMP 9127]